MRWHLLTGEFPPVCGGVGDYTTALADALARAGDDVEVWTRDGGATRGGITVHGLPDAFGRRAARVLEAAWQERPGIVLVQYVPQAFGRGGMNLRFCRWLARQRQQGTDVRTMFHEPYTYFSWRPRQIVQAFVQRRMAAVLLTASAHCYVSTETWIRYLRPYGELPDADVLPIPSTLPGDADAGTTARFRDMFSGGRSQPVIGHFGTYGRHVATELRALLPALAASVPSARFAFIGENGERFLQQVSTTDAALAARGTATGRLSPADAAAALTACDILVQPYPDGVTTRRTSVMAGLRGGVPTVTTSGLLTEPVWTATRAVALAAVGDPSGAANQVRSLLADDEARRALGARGREIYAREFSLERSVACLRGTAAPVSVPSA